MATKAQNLPNRRNSPKLVRFSWIHHLVSLVLSLVSCFLYICRGNITSVEDSLQIAHFMQNKPNLLDALMNVTSIIIVDYENIANCKLCQNKPNSNPNKANLLKAKMNVSTISTKDYENISNLTLFENKPNTKPIQTQTKPISNYPCVFELAVYNLVLRYGNVMQSMPNGRNFDGEYMKWQS